MRKTKAIKVVSPKAKRVVYASKRRNDRKKQNEVKNRFGDWADFNPRRDVGVFANIRTTYRHNGETKWT